MTISNSHFGIYNDGTISRVTHSTFSGNSTGIYSIGTIARVDSSTFSNNPGFGIYNQGTSASVSNSTFNGNGYGIFNNGTIGLISNNTVSGNQVGIFNNNYYGPSVTTTIVNNTIAGNSQAIINSSTISNLYNNLLVGNANNSISGTVTNQGNNPSGTFAALNVDSVLRNNGGSPQTHALLAGSMAANAGDNTKLPQDIADRDGDGTTTEPIPFDQRGTGFNRVVGGIVDIGAYESDIIPNALPTSADQSVTFNEDTVYTFKAADFAFADTDSGTFTSVKITQLPTVGQLFLDSDSNNLPGNGEAITTDQVLTVANLNTLKFKPAANGNGTNYANFQFQVNDGTSFSTAYTATLNVTDVNDVPSFTKGVDQIINEDAVPQTIPWATNLSAGATNESSQTLNFLVSNNNNALFAVQPTINAVGNLTYTSAANINGTATVTVQIKDNGGIDNGGIDTSAAQTFTINVTPINDAPILTGNATLTAVTQNSPNPSGSSLTSLFGSLFSDVDTGSSLSGLAIVGNTANATTQGRWQYSTDSTIWTNVGAVAEGATALAFSASTLVRFVPVTNYFGTPPGLTVRALDNTYSGGFTTGTTQLTVDTTNNGSTTAISGGTPATLNTSVTESLPSLLWRNGSTGQVAVWQLNGFALQTGYFLPYVVDGSWQISSDSADFNGDGIADILWRHQVTGENVIWEMNNTGLQSGSLIYQVADTNWQIAGTADFNDDGKSDILWRNKASGENAIWQMNGTAIQSADVIYRVADTNWQIAGTADFDGDGKSDILWRNKASGENAIWQMNGAAIQSADVIYRVADTNWQIAGTADFDGDGKSDILWRNKASGENSIWQMNGAAIKSADVITSLADVNWQIAGVADLGSDRTPDILWRNQQTGKEMIWRMSDSSYAQTYELPDVSDPNWIVKPFVADLETADLLP